MRGFSSMWGFSDTYWPLVIPLGILERCVSKLCKTAVPIDAFPFGGGGGAEAFLPEISKLSMKDYLSGAPPSVGP